MTELVIPLRVVLDLELAMVNVESRVQYDNQVTRQHMGIALVMYLGSGGLGGGSALGQVVPDLYRDSRDYYGQLLDAAYKDVHKSVRRFLQNTLSSRRHASEVWAAVEKGIQEINGRK